MVKEIGLTLLVTLSPLSELRGGIPLGILQFELDPWLTFVMAVIANALIFFPVFFLLRVCYQKLLRRIPLFERYLEDLRKRGKPVVERHGFWGLALFVAVPLPVTGAYTGTMLAWLVGMEWRKAFVAVALGVVVAGTIVLLLTLGVGRLGL